MKNELPPYRAEIVQNVLEEISFPKRYYKLCEKYSKDNDRFLLTKMVIQKALRELGLDIKPHPVDKSLSVVKQGEDFTYTLTIVGQHGSFIKMLLAYESVAVRSGGGFTNLAADIQRKNGKKLPDPPFPMPMTQNSEEVKEIVKFGLKVFEESFEKLS